MCRPKFQTCIYSAFGALDSEPSAGNRGEMILSCEADGGTWRMSQVKRTELALGFYEAPWRQLSLATQTVYKVYVQFKL